VRASGYAYSNTDNCTDRYANRSADCYSDSRTNGYADDCSYRNTDCCANRHTNDRSNSNARSGWRDHADSCKLCSGYDLG
jgi:hypothetical protein